MFKPPTRGLWVCTKCARDSVSRVQRRSWLSAASGAAPASHPVDRSAPGAVRDDAILRELFDSPARTAKAFKASELQPSAGLFKNRYLTSPNGFLVFARRSLQKASKIVDRVLGASSTAEYKAIVKDLDRLSDLLCRVLDLSDFVRMTHPDPRFQQAAAGAWSLVYQYMNQLNTMTGLSDQLTKALANKDVVASWSEEEKTVAEILKLDFTKSAVNLPQRERDRFVDLSQQISEVGSAFVSEMAPEKDEIVLPSSSFYGLYPSIARALTRGGKVRLPSMSAEAQAALRTVKDEDTRRAVFVASRTASRRTVHRLDTMLKLRSELAELSGFQSYAHLALKDRMMAKSPGSVMQFLLALQQHNKPIVQKEMADLLAQKQTHLDGMATKVQPWDKDYLMDSVRLDMRLPVRHPDQLAAYFSIGTVMQGLSRLFSRLYGIRFVPRETLPGETWHEDVRRLDVVTDAGDQIAVLYCDLFFRKDKSPNPAHFTVRCSREISESEVEEAAAEVDGGDAGPRFDSAAQAANDGMESATQGGVFKQLPTIALVCDFQKHEDWKSPSPALLTFHQVETLFHEMGHAIHSILARTSLQNVAGTRCATDFAELPSTLMEHFAADPTVLALFARHWRTDEPLPYAMIAERLRMSKRFEGFDTENQILLAMLDQAYHGPDVAGPGFDSTRVYHGLQSAFAAGPPDPPETCWQGFFGHLHGYGSTYYSYLFDRVLAERVWRVVFAAGADGKAVDRASGERLKENLLKWGGSRDAWRCLSDTLQDERLQEGDEKAMAIVGSWGIKDDHHA
ncbi:Mitochondrial intermediate peptidase [Verticillium nonalfalfae]|uniref:Mitochondrial intermediate peptidase n=1 Tax=Verticillium nonalfalfae TaxID=1051616 RepID=A0A3M9Y285_9PEZI|nr:Mitochondrial intermediate peptidase [Verticillium nonalfalfae]RNJ53250.1 Mitochondrial intermediate peptidase [Verticillium nonalfalfae]